MFKNYFIPKKFEFKINLLLNLNKFFNFLKF